MKSLLFVFLILTADSRAAAQDQETKPTPTPAVCKADLKTWSGEKTDALAIDQLMFRMNEMVACGDQEKKHEKKMRAYLDEFYRTHNERANRTFDFIEKHDLKVKCPIC